MTLPTDEVVNRLEKGMETLDKVKNVFWPWVVSTVKLIVSNPVFWISIILIGALITTTILKRHR